MISKLLVIASCAATLAFADMEEKAEEAARMTKVQGVAGHVVMKVHKNGRRLQELTGFAQDDRAKKAVATALESKCGDDCKSKVHTYESERQGEATSERRLLSADGLVDLNYTVDCDESHKCQAIWAKLNGVVPSDLTTAVTAELQEGNITEYTVVVENHLVDQVPCAIFGAAYNDPFRNSYLNGQIVATAMECQMKCAHTLFCTYFSWYKDSGGCWLQGNYSKLEVAGGKAQQFAISGPAVCDSVPEFPVEIAMKQEGAAALDAAVGGAKEEGSGDGFSWLPIVGGVAAVGVVGAIGAYMTMGGKEKKTKTKTTRGIKKARDFAAKAEAGTSEEVAPLTAPTPAVEMPQIPAYSTAQMPAYSTAQPMQYQQPMYQQPYQYPQQQYYSSGYNPGSVAQPMASVTPQYAPYMSPQ